MKLTILMPCLNEAETIGRCIKKANAWLNQTKTIGEIIIADNGSIDGSQNIARRNGARVIDVPIRGYGSALYFGSLQAKGKYIIVGDSDDSYDFSKLDKFIKKLDCGFDLVVGNRFLGGIKKGAMPWKNRYIGNPILSFIGTFLFKCPVKDFHCGLRGYTMDAFLKMNLRTTGMEFASEMIIKASLLGMKITEVPTILSKDGRSRQPHLRPWRDGWRHLSFMLLYCPRWLFLIPGIVGFFISVFIYFFIFINPIKIGNLVLEINTMLFAQAAIIISLMTVFLGVLVRIFSFEMGLLQENKLLERARTSTICAILGAVGILFIIIGIYMGIDLLSEWGYRIFGELKQGEFLKFVSLSTLVLTFGGITLLASIIIGFLTISARRFDKENSN